MTFQEFDDRIRVLLAKHPQWETEECLHDEISMRLQGEFCDHLLLVSLPELYEQQEKTGFERTADGIEDELRAVEKVHRRQRSLNFQYHLDGDGKALFEKLRKKRADLASERHVPPYVIFSNRTLYEMCSEMPGDEKAMRALYGVGEVNFARYGEEFLGVIREFQGKD